jgi:hypothetical protein
MAADGPGAVGRTAVECLMEAAAPTDHAVAECSAVVTHISEADRRDTARRGIAVVILVAVLRGALDRTGTRTPAEIAGLVRAGRRAIE